jgi:hypothetical protein
MAARAAIAIRIGTRGEEELLSEEDVWPAAGCLPCEELFGDCPAPPCCPAVEALPGLPWPVPPPLPVLGLLFADDAPLDEDPDPEEPEFPECV